MTTAVRFVGGEMRPAESSGVRASDAGRHRSRVFRRESGRFGRPDAAPVPAADEVVPRVRRCDRAGEFEVFDDGEPRPAHFATAGQVSWRRGRGEELSGAGPAQGVEVGPPLAEHRRAIGVTQERVQQCHPRELVEQRVE